MNRSLFSFFNRGVGSIFAISLCLAAPPNGFCSDSFRGNETFQSFNKAKKILEHEIVFDHRVTLYCRAPFDKDKWISLPEGFTTQAHQKRANRVEWEHVVPAENFGRFFAEWREGSPMCVDNRGSPFKGRKCAEKSNITFRLMQSDMYNLSPPSVPLTRNGVTKISGFFQRQFKIPLALVR